MKFDTQGYSVYGWVKFFCAWYIYPQNQGITHTLHAWYKALQPDPIKGWHTIPLLGSWSSATRVISHGLSIVVRSHGIQSGIWTLDLLISRCPLCHLSYRASGGLVSYFSDFFCNILKSTLCGSYGYFLNFQLELKRKYGNTHSLCTLSVLVLTNHGSINATKFNLFTLNFDSLTTCRVQSSIELGFFKK